MFCSYQKSIIRNTEHFYKYMIWMYLKTDTILLQCTFHQFQYFITTCLCLVEIYLEIFQSNSFNRNDLIVFKWDLSCCINKLSAIRSLNLFAWEVRISKWSKSIEQLHSSRWSDITDCLTLLRLFPVKLHMPICSAALVKKWWHVLP